VRVRGAARYLSNAYDLDEGRVVLAGGAVFRIGQYVALSGDYAAMLDRPDDFDNAWSGAVQLAIPYSPHTLSLHVTNANTATLQGSSAGRGDQRRYGFEFTIPVTLRRYFRSPAPAIVTPDSSGMANQPPTRTVTDSAVTRRDPVAVIDTAALRRDSIARMDSIARADSIARQDSVAAARERVRLDSLAAAAARGGVRDTTPARVAPPPAARRPAPAPTATGRMRQFTFSPGRMTITAGTTITWTNTDPVPHTITADDGSWNSGVIEPGKTWRRRFDRPGTFSFHCTPHPFMKGVIVVRAAP
jgi:plastocyanin